MSAWLETRIREEVGKFSLDVSFEMNREIGVLFGPSGSGKSLTLRTLAGLRKTGEGVIRLGDRTLLDSSAGVCVSPHRRKMGLLFQDLALFPHMTVLENVLFGCEKPKSAIARSKAREWLARVRLESYESRYPSRLSGGQKQRVALARALAAEPDMLLLDEPFSALDGPLRRNLRRELRELQAQARVPILYVTHQVEDLCALGDRVFFIEKGRLTGSATVRNLLEGQGRMRFWQMMGWGNLLEGAVETGAEGSPVFRWASGALTLGSVQGRGRAMAFIRPDRVRLLDPRLPVDEELSKNRFSGRVEEVLLEGGAVRMHVRTASGHWQIGQGGPGAPSEVARPGENVHFAVPPRSVELVFGSEPKEEERVEPSVVESCA